jgi:hypothetical protein
MAREGIGLTEKLNPEPPMLGYTDKSTVKLDFDDVHFKVAKYWALRTMKWFRLRGFIILRSSKRHYHVVFNRSVTWKKNTHIMAWVCVESKNDGLQKWFLMQCIKESSTLRVSSKREKASPKVIYRYGTQDSNIKCYMRVRIFVKNLLEKDE